MGQQFTFIVDRLKRAVLSKLQDRFKPIMQKDKEENQPKMTVYATITQGQTYMIEPYLLVNTKSEYRKALCRLHISAHDLQTEGERYPKTARVGRKCRTCGVVDDE